MLARNRESRLISVFRTPTYSPEDERMLFNVCSALLRAYCCLQNLEVPMEEDVLSDIVPSNIVSRQVSDPCEGVVRTRLISISVF